MIKFLHILFALTLLSSTLYLVFWVKTVALYRHQFNYFLLLFALLAALTGTLLIYPKHFTFHTPWIKAAYILVFLFCLSALIITKINLKQTWVLQFIYFFMLMMLTVLVHDAVMKSTFLI